jgi:hypothetical protein
MEHNNDGIEVLDYSSSVSNCQFITFRRFLKIIKRKFYKNTKEFCKFSGVNFRLKTSRVRMSQA